MADNDTFDITIIGAGPGGYVAAIKAAQLGLRVALVEKKKTLGGTCLNVGCIPSKALLSSSELLYRMRWKAGEHGISARDINIDITVLMNRKRQVVEKLTTGVAGLMKHNNVDVFYGTATIPEPGAVHISPPANPWKPGNSSETTATNPAEEVSLRTENIVLATGSIPVELPMLPFDGELIIDSAEALAMEEIPKKLLVVGAGAIGLELGSVWSRLGSEVVFVEIMDSVLPGWDRQISTGLKRVLGNQGMEFFLKTSVTGYEKTNTGVMIKAENENGEELKLEADRVLVAAGRRSYCSEEILTSLGVETDERGFIRISESFETGQSRVFAIGDAVPGPMLAHKAEEEGVAVAEIIAGKPGLVNYHAIPSVVYTAPEAASVGKTEAQLKKENTPYKKGVFQFKANGRALTSGEDEGFVKVLSDAETDRVLGVHILGELAGSLISEAVTVIEFEGSAEDIGRTIHAHPTYSEALKEAALGAYDKSLHGF